MDAARAYLGEHTYNTLWWLACATSLCIAMSLVVKRLDPKASMLYGSFPRYKYISSMVWELTALPYCGWLLLRDTQLTSLSSISQFAALGYADFTAHGIPCLFFHFLIGSQLKDFITGPLELCR